MDDRRSFYRSWRRFLSESSRCEQRRVHSRGAASWARYTTDMNQRGGVGIPVVIAVVGGLVILYVGYAFVGSLGSNDVQDVAITANPRGGEQPRGGGAVTTQSVVSFDDNLFTDGQNFYLRISDGVDENGNETYSYIKADIADAKTFRKVPSVGDADAGIGNTGKKMPGFYMDSQHVYFFSGGDIAILNGADPNTFQILSPTYAKDAEHVYYVNVTCDAAGTCSGTVTVVAGADPDTFQTFHNTPVPDPDGSGTVVIDAKDGDNIYYYGTWVGPLPDPDDHSLHPDTNNPVLISP